MGKNRHKKRFPVALSMISKRVYTNEYGGIHHFDNAPGSHDPDPGTQEKGAKKSCVSFETGCSNNSVAHPKNTTHVSGGTRSVIFADHK